MDFVSAKLIFAFIVLFFLLAYWVFNFIILYHLARFGIGTQPKKLAAIFLLGSVVLFFISISVFSGLDINSLKLKFTELAKPFVNTTYIK